MALSDLAEMAAFLGFCYFTLLLLLPQVPHKDPPKALDTTPSSPPLAPFLLRLPVSVREKVYLLLEYTREDDSGQKCVLNMAHAELRTGNISEWSSAHQRLNEIFPTYFHEPRQGRFANQLFYVSRAISQDARCFFYSQNDFLVRGMEDEGLAELSALTMAAIRSFRNVQVHIYQENAGSDDDGYFRRKNKAAIDWKEFCYRLAHAPPCQLRLSLSSRSSIVGSANELLRPLAYLELKECSVAFYEAWSPRLHRYAKHVVSKTTERSRSQKSSEAFHRFGDLPTELQMKVLEYTDLLPSTEIHAQGLKWHPCKQEFFPLNCMNFFCASWDDRRFETPCRARQVAWSSSQCCWHVPKALFQTSQSMKEQAQFIFYRSNHFAVDVCFLRPFDMRSDGTPSVLVPFPPDCLQHLRSIQWNFPSDMAIKEFQSPGNQTIKLVQTVRYLRERVKLSNLTLTLSFLTYLERTRTPAELDSQYALAEHMVESITPHISELKDFFVHIDWPDIDADRIKSMEQALEKTVKGETYDSRERWKRRWEPGTVQWPFPPVFRYGSG